MKVEKREEGFCVIGDDGVVCKVCATQAEADNVIKAAHGETTGKPSIQTITQLLNKAIHDDPRLDTDSHGQPEGSPYDLTHEPWVVDILWPDDDGATEAVVRTDDGRLVRVGFTWDGNEVTLSDTDPVETIATVVYAKAIAEYEAAVQASAEMGHPFYGNQWTEGEEAMLGGAKVKLDKKGDVYDWQATVVDPGNHPAGFKQGEKVTLKEKSLSKPGGRDIGFRSQDTARETASEFARSADAMRGAQAVGTHHHDEQSGRDIPAVEFMDKKSERQALKKMDEHGIKHHQVGERTHAVWHPSMRIGREEKPNVEGALEDQPTVGYMSGMKVSSDKKDFEGEEQKGEKIPSREEHQKQQGKAPTKDWKEDIHHSGNNYMEGATDEEAKKNIEGHLKFYGFEKKDEENYVHKSGERMARVTKSGKGYSSTVYRKSGTAASKPGFVERLTENAGKGKETRRSKSDDPNNASEPPTEGVVQCRDVGAKLPEWDGVPNAFQWMPGGVTTIVAHYNGRPIELTVECTPDTAGIVQASLENWRSQYPKIKPFGCIEHREEEAAFWPKEFNWRDEPEPGVFCSADWTTLGERNVVGKVHRSFSPSFTTDAEYAKAKDMNGVMTFPKGVRGSRTNPANITGVAFSVGSLTNKPAFKNILPVKAKEAAVKASAQPGHEFYGNQYTSGGAPTASMKDDEKVSRMNDVYSALQKAKGYRTSKNVLVSSKTDEAHIEHNDEAESKRVMSHLEGQGRKVRRTGKASFAMALRASQATNLSPTGDEQATPQPVKATNADQTKGNRRMRIKLKVARDGKAAGSYIKMDEDEAKDLIKAEEAVELTPELEQLDAREAEVKALKEARTRDQQAVIKAKIADAKKLGKIAPKDDTYQARCFERLDKGTADLETICELIDGLPVQAKGGKNDLGERVTGSQDGPRLSVTAISIGDAARGIVQCREPMNKLIQGDNNLKEALKLSQQEAAIYAAHFGPILRRGDDVAMQDIVRAADFTDPDSQVGTLVTGLILQRNLGFLKNKLGWLPYLTTDLSGEPTKYNQPILTRYITPPNLLTYVAGVGYTSDSSAISAYSAQATQTSGTLTKSVPSTTDVTVTLNQHKGVEIEFATQRIASTVRNLFAEQQAAQFYTLAEAVNSYVLATIFGATWSGTTPSYTKALANWDIKGMVGIKAALSLSKVPDVGRFCLMHSLWHDKLLEDTNLVLANTIMAALGKSSATLESGELPPLFGIKPIETQLASYANGTYTAITDPGNLGAVNNVGFAGTSASMVFVSRVPTDYTALAGQMGIPATAAVEIATEPDSGLSVMFVKYVNHTLGSVSARCALMYGAAQGHPKVGTVLKAV